MAGSKTVKKTAEYTKRFDERYDELKWLYCELYGSMDMFYRLCRTMKDFFVRFSVWLLSGEKC